jgi:hypothetical protein
MSNLSMTKAGAEVCLRLRERLGRFLQLPRAAGKPATKINTADAASNAVQVVDPNEVNEIDRAASVESSWVNYLLWMLAAALAVAFAMWFFSRMRFLFGRRSANAG